MTESVEALFFRSLGASYMTGPVYFGEALNQTGQLSFYNSSSANATIFQAGNNTAEVTYTLPTAAPTANGSALTATTAGVMSWGGLIRLLQTPVFASETTGGSQTTLAFASKGASLTITPTSASSTIYLWFSGRVNSAAAGGVALLGLTGTTTGDLVTTTNTPYTMKGTANTTVSGFFKDAPGTVSAQTYALRLSGDGVNAAAIGGAAATGSLTYLCAFEVI